MSAQLWAPIAFVFVTFAVCLFMLFVPAYLGGKSQGKAKEELYESGVLPSGTAKLRLSADFYLIAIFFVIFDLEALYLYVYAVSVRDVGWFGFYGALVFALILLIGLIYELSLGTLNWAPEYKYKKPAVVNAENFDLSLATTYTNFQDLVADKTGKIPAQLTGKTIQKGEADDKAL